MKILYRISKYGEKYIIKVLIDPQKKYMSRNRKYTTTPWSCAFIANVRGLIQNNVVVLNKVELRSIAKEYSGQFEHDLKAIVFNTREQAKRFRDEILFPQEIAKKLIGV